MTNVLYNLVKERNARETDPFVDIYQAYEALMNLVDHLQQKCQEKDRELLEYAAASEIHTADAESEEYKKQASKREAQLRQQVDKLQEELNAKLKLENESTRAQLKQATELAELKENLAQNNTLLQNLKTDNQQANETIESLLTRLNETEKSLHQVQTQNGQLKDSLDQIRTENEHLTKTNETLVGRLVTDKEQMMDQFNKMNALLEHQQHEMDMMRALKQQQEHQVSRLSNRKTLAEQAQDDMASSGMPVPISPIQPPSTPQYIHRHCHKGEIVALRFDPQGPLATAGSDGVVKVWDPSKALLMNTLRASGAGQPLLCVDISGELVVAGSSDKSCRIWSLKTSRMIHHLIGHASKVMCVRLTPDHSSVWSASADRTLKLWDISRGTYRQTCTLRHGSAVHCLDLHCDASTVVSGHLDGGLRFWDTRQSTESTQPPTLEIPNLHSGGISSVEFDPKDSTRLLTFGRDATLKLVDVRKTDQVIQEFSHPKLVIGTSFTASASLSPDGAHCVVGNASSNHCLLYVWRVCDGKLVKELKAHTSPLQGVAWGSSGVASVDKGGTLVLWS